MGSYKLGKQKKLQQFLKEGDVFFDLGAHVGFFTLLASHFVGDQGRVVAIEPNPDSIKCLKKHIEWNHRKNITVFEAAIGDRNCLVSFDPSRHSAMGSVSSTGSMTVQMLSLDYLYEAANIPAPQIIKIDIEGSECMALKGAQKLISECRPVIFVSSHGTELHQDCISLFGELDYRVDCIDEEPEEIVAIPNN